MADQNLVSFIKTSLKKGSSEEDITKTLLDEGWQNEMISEGFKKIEISRSENINNPVDKIEFLTSLPKTKKIGWKIFFTFILLLLTLYYIYFNLLSVLLIQIYKYINILSTLSSFVWLLTIVTSFFLIYVYTKNILEPNSNFNKFFKTSYIGGLVLIISYFGYIFFGYIFLPEISAYIFALINIIFPVLSSRFPEFIGLDPLFAQKDPVEITDVLKSAIRRQCGNGEIRFHKQRSGLGDPDIIDKI